MGRRELIAKRIRELEVRAAAGEPANALAPGNVVKSRQDLRLVKALSVQEQRLRSRKQLKGRRPQKRR